MPKIRPISDLRNYTDVLNQVTVGEPVFLTKNGRGRYAVVDLEEYDKMCAYLKMFPKSEEEYVVSNENFLSNEELEALLGEPQMR